MQRIDHNFQAMGGPCQIRLYSADAALGQRAIHAAVVEVERLEQKYSRYRNDSLTTRVNLSAGSGRTVTIDAETAGLLRYADTLWRESDGLFDLTAGILRRAWDFRSGVLPTQSAIEQLLPLIGWSKVTWDSTCVSLPEKGMELDFGGCVKEYACDSVVAVLRNIGIAHALVDLAGDIAVVGSQADGQPWLVGIRHPDKKHQAIAQIPLYQGGLASSGDYERCLKVDGRRYGHILNPNTGWPMDGLVAVTVLAQQCLVAGSSATLGMLMPQDAALSWLSELGLPWLAVDRHGQCYGSIASAD